MQRSILHLILGVLLWIVFGYYWHLVAQRPITPHTRVALITVSIIVVAVTLFQVIWVIHNTRMSRRRERRISRRKPPAPPETDFMGRTFIARSESDLRRAFYIEVHLVEMSDKRQSAGHKVFRIADRRPS